MLLMNLNLKFYFELEKCEKILFAVKYLYGRKADLPTNIDLPTEFPSK